MLVVDPLDKVFSTYEQAEDLEKCLQNIKEKLAHTSIPVAEHVTEESPCCCCGGHKNGEQKRPKQKFRPPAAMICYKISEKSGKRNKVTEVKRVKKSKSRELRASILYMGCRCEKRDGLQDDCQRSDCMGSPECLVRPPICGPSEFADAKHLLQKIKKGTHTDYEVENNKLIAEYRCFPAVVKSC